MGKRRDFSPVVGQESESWFYDKTSSEFIPWKISSEIPLREEFKKIRIKFCLILAVRL